MDYKTILVHVDESAHAQNRMEYAAHMALKADAHLIGAATTGMSARIFEWIALGAQEVDLDMMSDMLRRRAERALDRFEELARRVGVASFERRLIEDVAAAAIAMQARYCDLTIVSQSDPRDATSSVSGSFPELVVMESGCPVVILPGAHHYLPENKRILVAWNASPEARKSIHYALPLLGQAATVELAVFNPAGRPEAFGEDPGADIALFLARHGIRVNVLRRDIQTDIGSALVALSDELDADLIVMGCYGHARLREVMLGGTTRTVLESMTCPVFMSH